MSAFLRLSQWMGTQPWFPWLGRNVLTPLDTWSGGRFPTLSTFGSDLPMLYLTTIGRTSGERRTSPLLYLSDADRYVVIGTNFGGERHPGWTYNLEADPTAWVAKDDTREVPVVARRVTSPEEAELYWTAFGAVWRGYDTYRDRASHRDIRLYVLDPEAY